MTTAKGSTRRSRKRRSIRRTSSGSRGSVHLANKKSGFFAFDGLLGDVVYGPTGVAPRRRNASVVNPKDLWLDPGVRRIGGRSAGPVEFSRTTPAIGPSFWPRQPLFPPIEYVGELRTDPAGRLVVLGGRGAVASIAGAADIRYYNNNDGWFDDIADGPVDALIKLKGVPQAVKAVAAWVLCAPPCFAPYSQHIVTLWDTLFDLNAREVKLPVNDARFDGPLKALKAINREFYGRAWGENTLKQIHSGLRGRHMADSQARAADRVPVSAGQARARHARRRRHRRRCIRCSHRRTPRRKGSATRYSIDCIRRE